MAKRKLTKYNILIIAFAALGSLTFGYSNMIIGSTLGQPTFVYVQDPGTWCMGTYHS